VRRLTPVCPPGLVSMTLISTYSSLLPARLWLAFVCVIGIASGTWRNVQFVQAHAESLAVYNLGVDAATYEEAAQRLARRPRLRLINAAQPPGFVMALGLIHRAFGPERLPIKQIFCGLVALTACLAWCGGAVIPRRLQSLLCPVAPGAGEVHSRDSGVHLEVDGVNRCFSTAGRSAASAHPACRGHSTRPAR